MTREPLGEEALILRGLPGGEAWKAAKWLEAAGIPGVIEANAAWDTVGVYVDPTAFDADHLDRRLEEMTLEDVPPGKIVRIPVSYGGDDLESSAAELSISARELIDLHQSAEYTCFAVGFCPGFPYLSGLPAPLNQLARLEAPRLRVPPGSVAIAAGQCGIYPSEKPGGWRLIGRTSVEIADEGHHQYLIAPGDRVRFEEAR